ncbi:DUF3040 domain-containing protein [Streptomyces pactum]|uniref:DUF3040 domain-containing protein n=1 Tax=Streptomyces pactum TaxID=68249 RepID=A0A1S6J9L4_9ACTN|nr:DUF3040 domain-containing protein [Streptomyces pactum]AQS68433.1 hypothetical protein B1H29_17170 [Streptomyces pactum]
MPGPDGSDDHRLSDIESRLHRDDPRFAHALDAGRPRPPREYRNLRARLLLATALAVLCSGIVLAHGLLIASGLVLAGIAVESFDPHRHARGGRYPPPRSWPRS